MAVFYPRQLVRRANRGSLKRGTLQLALPTQQRERLRLRPPTGFQVTLLPRNSARCKPEVGRLDRTEQNSSAQLSSAASSPFRKVHSGEAERLAVFGYYLRLQLIPQSCTHPQVSRDVTRGVCKTTEEGRGGGGQYKTT